MGRATARQVWRDNLRGPLGVRAVAGSQQFAGFASVVSGTATATISTAAVTSGDLIFLSQQAVATIGSGTGLRQWEVQSITDRTSFIIGTTDGQGVARTTVLGWMIFKTG